MKNIAIAAGKGGVGKTTVTAMIALCLNELGFRVGIIDADVYGPSIGFIFSSDEKPKVRNGKVIPVKTFGVSTMSSSHLGFVSEPVSVRAPIANHMISQFVDEVDFGELDFLLYDFPPGTGDVQLTLLQRVTFDEAILVTTPQVLSLCDVEKALLMFQKFQVKTLGLVENMAYVLTETMTKLYPFGRGYVEKFCEKYGLSLLGKLGLDEKISYSLDHQKNIYRQLSEDSKKAVDQIVSKILESSDEEKAFEPFEILWNQDMR